MSANDGGPAYPVSNISGASPATPDELKRMAVGMSLRDYFAGLEDLSDCQDLNDIPRYLCGPPPQNDLIAFLNWEATWRAKIKYIRAEAMLAERAKRMQPADLTDRLRERAKQ